MKCSKCGFESDGNFCSNCGAKLEPENITSPPVETQNTQQELNKEANIEDNQNNNKTRNIIIAVVLITFAVMIILGIVFDYVTKNYSINIEDTTYSDSDSYDYEDNYSDYDSSDDSDSENDYEDYEPTIEYKKVGLKKLVNNCWDDYYEYVKTTIKVTKCKPDKGEYSYTTYDYDGYDRVTVKFKNVYPKKKKINVGGYLTVKGTMSYKESSDNLTVTVKADSRTKTDKTLFKKLGTEVKIPQEYKNALATAKSYDDTTHMSKKKLYEQLTSEYGENFPAAAAQYAVDNLKADYKKNALITAKSYYKDMHMSKNEVYDQLVSDYGEGFTPEEARYAVNHLN